MKHIAKTKKTQIYVRSLLVIAVSMSLFCTACAARPQPRAEGESAEAQDELSESALSPESAASPLVSPEPSDGKEPEREAMEKGAKTSVSLSIEKYSAVNSPTQVAEGAVMVRSGSAEDNIDCQDIGTKTCKSSGFGEYHCAERGRHLPGLRYGAGNGENFEILLGAV